MISLRAIAIMTLGVGVMTFGALVTEARTANPRPFDMSAIRDLLQARSGPSRMEQVAMSANGFDSDGVGHAAATGGIPHLPPEAPAAPGLVQLAQGNAAAGRATDQDLSPFGLPCGLSVSATPMEGARVALDIMDPCQAHSRVVIEHSGLNLTGQTDVMGLLTMDIPVFEAPAFFTVRMPDGSSDSALAIIPDLQDYYRVGVQWNEDRQLELHAMEYGATYGEPGHIWLDNPGNVDRAVAGEGGYVVQVGTAEVESPMLAQIYSFPRAALEDAGTVRMSIEVPITETNCGQDTLARTLELEEDGTTAVIELTFTLPGCDAVGDYLVLQNLLQDLRVASN